MGFTEADKDRAIRLYFERYDIPVQAICAEIGISHMTLGKWVRSRGQTMERGTWSPYPPDYQERVVQFYVDNPKMRSKDICKRFGISSKVLVTWLNSRGTPVTKRYIRNYPEDTIMKAVARYREGDLVVDILAEVGCSKSTLTSWLHAHGVPMDHKEKRKGTRNVNHPNAFPEFKVRQGINMYQAGKPVPEICEAVGCKKYALYEWLKQRGIQPDRGMANVAWMKSRGATRTKAA